MSGRTLIYGTAGEALVKDEVVSEVSKVVLIDAYGALAAMLYFGAPTGLIYEEWKGRGGPAACLEDIANRIVDLVGKEALTARYPTLKFADTKEHTT